MNGITIHPLSYLSQKPWTPLPSPPPPLNLLPHLINYYFISLDFAHFYQLHYIPLIMPLNFSWLCSPLNRTAFLILATIASHCNSWHQELNPSPFGVQADTLTTEQHSKFLKTLKWFPMFLAQYSNALTWLIRSYRFLPLFPSQFSFLTAPLCLLNIIVILNHIWFLECAMLASLESLKTWFPQHGTPGSVKVST